MSEQAPRNRRRTAVGIVSSNKMNKTIVVEVERLVLHPRFKKYVRRTTRYKAHDEQGEAMIGDKVEITQTRPLSKDKCHRLVRIVTKNEAARVIGAQDQEV